MTTATTGKGKYGTRQYCKAYPLDGTKMTEVFHANIAAIYGPDMSTDGLEVQDGQFVAVEVKDDGSLPGRKWKKGSGETTWAILCSEGVGWVADDYNAIHVSVLGRYGSDSRMFIYVKRVPEMFTGEVVNLADFVRTFGDRLESNFDMWYSHAVDEAKK